MIVNASHQPGSASASPLGGKQLSGLANELDEVLLSPVIVITFVSPDGGTVIT
jgi:hypothetical protein